jgi:hypothetical protein
MVSNLKDSGSRASATWFSPAVARSLSLVGWLALLAVGIGVGVLFWREARKTDADLLLRYAGAPGLVRSIVETRDMYIGMFGGAVLLAGYSLARTRALVLASPSMLRAINLVALVGLTCFGALIVGLFGVILVRAGLPTGKEEVWYTIALLALGLLFLLGGIWETRKWFAKSPT